MKPLRGLEAQHEDSMLRAIVSFHQDEEGHWVADLACGHTQHVRHRPPFVERPWVVTAAGRAARIGTQVPCKACDDERAHGTGTPPLT